MHLDEKADLNHHCKISSSTQGSIACDSRKDLLCYYKHENIISFAIIHIIKYAEIHLIHYDTSVFIKVKTARRGTFQNVLPVKKKKF